MSNLQSIIHWLPTGRGCAINVDNYSPLYIIPSSLSVGVFTVFDKTPFWVFLNFKGEYNVLKKYDIVLLVNISISSYGKYQLDTFFHLWIINNLAQCQYIAYIQITFVNPFLRISCNKFITMCLKMLMQDFVMYLIKHRSNINILP